MACVGKPQLAEKPLPRLEVIVAAIADFQHRHILGDVQQNLILIVEIDGDPLQGDDLGLFGEAADQDHLIAANAEPGDILFCLGSVGTIRDHINVAGPYLG